MYEQHPLDHEESPEFTESENVNLENELLLMKLKAEFGGEHFMSEDLPPQLTNQFLQSVYDFEKAYVENGDQISVYEKISSPYIVPIDSLNEEGVLLELNRLTKLLADKNILLDCIYETNPRVLYRFISEELMKQEVDTITIEGFYLHFIYEEFYPNVEEDIKSHLKDFILELINRSLREDWNILSNQFFLSGAGAEITARDAYNRINDSLSEFEQLDLISLEFTSIQKVDQIYEVDYSICYNATCINNEVINIQGNGNGKFMQDEHAQWTLAKFTMPGLVL